MLVTNIYSFKFLRLDVKYIHCLNLGNILYIYFVSIVFSFSISYLNKGTHQGTQSQNESAHYTEVS